MWQKDGKEERRRRQDAEDWTQLDWGLQFQGESFPLRQGTSPPLFHIFVLVGKPGASLQRLLGGGPCPFYKLRGGHPRALTPLPSSPLGTSSQNTMVLTECCDANPRESILVRAEDSLLTLKRLSWLQTSEMSLVTLSLIQQIFAKRLL